MVVRIRVEDALRKVGALRRKLALADIEVLRPRVCAPENQPADGVDVADQHVEDEAGAPALDAVLLRRQSAERVQHRRPVTKLLAVDLDRLADPRLLGERLRESGDGGGGNVRDFLGVLRRDVLDAVGEHLERRAHRLAVDGVTALQRRLDALDVRLRRGSHRVPYQRRLAILVLEDDAGCVDELRRVGELDEKRLVDGVGVDHHLGHRQEHHDILARTHRHPLVGLARTGREPGLDHDRLHSDLLAAHRALPVEPARRLLAFEVIGAAVEEELRVLEIGQDAGAGPRQLVGNVAGRFAGGRSVHHVRGAERLGERLAELFLDQVLALPVLPHQFGRILGADFGQTLHDFGERLVPRNLDPLRVFVATLLRVGALHRLLEAVRVVRVPHPGRTLRADAVVVELGARSIGIDGPHDAVDDGGVDAAEVRADRAARLHVLNLNGWRGDSAFGRLRSLRSLCNGVEADAGCRDARHRSHPFQETAPLEFHAFCLLCGTVA